MQDIYIKLMLKLLEQPRRRHAFAGTDHVGFLPTRQALLAPNAKRREVFRESHER